MNLARQQLRQHNFKLIDFRAQPLQVPVIEDDHRIKLIAGGEGAGKSYVAAAMLYALWPAWKLAYIVGPKYQSCRPEFDYVANWLQQTGQISRDEVSAPVNGAAAIRSKLGIELHTISAEDGPNAVTGTGKSPEVILMVEAGKMGYDIFLACRNRIARSRGILIISGTFEGSEGWYPEYYEKWRSGDNPEGAKSFSLPTWSNLALYPGGENDPEILALKATNPHDVFMERFAAVPMKPSTLVFPEFNYLEHVLEAPFWKGDNLKDVEVELAIDPGYAGAYAVIPLVRYNNLVWVIDEVYEQHKVTEQVINIARQRPWWPYWKGKGVIDIAARQHQGLPSVIEEWRRITGHTLFSDKVGIKEGIDRYRTFLIKDPVLGIPRLQFDPRAKNTIWEMSKGYKYPDEKDATPTREEPVDKNNHAVKAIGYFLFARFGAADTRIKRVRKPKRPNPWKGRI